MVDNSYIWIIIAIVAIVIIIKAKINWDKEPQKVSIEEVSNMSKNANYFVAIAATILFPITGIPHLVLLLYFNNKRNETLLGVLEIINTIVLSLILIAIVGFLVLFGTCLIAMSHH